MEKDIFRNSIRCFVSTQDIASGEDWYNKIKGELQSSSLGIVCVTKENVKAPWLFFEAGALIGNNMRVIPLLINCDQGSLDHSPISSKQSIQFYLPDRFYKMLYDISKEFGLLSELSENEKK